MNANKIYFVCEPLRSVNLLRDLFPETFISRSRFTCGAHLARSINKNYTHIFSLLTILQTLRQQFLYDVTWTCPGLSDQVIDGQSPDWRTVCAQTKITIQAILQMFRCGTCCDSHMVYSLLSKPNIINESALILMSLTRDDATHYCSSSYHHVVQQM